jgi:multidrug efflux system membrane fusion protein
VAYPWTRGVLPAALGVLLTACSPANGTSPSGPAAQRGLAVRTAPVATRDVVYKVHALGSLEPEEVVQITAEVGGAVKEVTFHAGDRVTPDTVLARIDPERYRLEALRADAAYRRAVADWQRSESDLARREELAKDQLVAVEELNRVRQETERLSADTSAAKAALEIAQQNARRADVRAPRPGEINTRTVDTGQFVDAGTVLATLVDLRRLRLRFKVSEAESLKAKVGQEVRFRVGSLGDTDFAAKVYHVGDVADPATRQVEILAWVENPGVLKPGFFAEVMLATETRTGAVVVNEGAVQASERGFVVFVVKDGKAYERPVQIGLRTGDGSVEIVSGLSVGETIVTEGSDRLGDGMPVQPVEAAATPAGAV